jgi:hypothetical protein
VADKAAAVRGVVDVPAAAADRVVVDRVVVDKAAVEEAASPVVEGAADPLAAVVEWEAEARVVVEAASPVVGAAAETASTSDSRGASRICGAPLFY